MYGAKEQRASTDTASLRSMARLSAYAKVADGAERPPSVVAAGVLISDSVSGVERLQPLVEASSQRAFRLQLPSDPCTSDRFVSAAVGSASQRCRSAPGPIHQQVL